MGTGQSISNMCCAGKERRLTQCRNDRLNLYLNQLVKRKQTICLAWLYQEQRFEPPLLAQTNQRRELPPFVEKEPHTLLLELTGASSDRRYVRLDWGYDGLAFLEVCERLPEECLVVSRVFEPPIEATELLSQLTKVQLRTFDMLSWNSEAFCFHMIDRPANDMRRGGARAPSSRSQDRGEPVGHSAADSADGGCDDPLAKPAKVARVGVDDGGRLTAALRFGRLAEAHVALLQLEAAGGSPQDLVGSAAEVARVHRVGATYAASVRLLNWSPESFPVYERNQGLHLEWGLQLVDGILRLVTVADFVGLDFVRSAVALCEKDLEGSYNRDFLRGEVVGAQSAYDFTWHGLGYSKLNCRMDDVSQVSIVDAIAEPLGGLWVASSSPAVLSEAEAQERTGPGQEYPSPQDGYHRPVRNLAVTTQVPLHNGRGDRMRGLRRTQASETRLPPELQRALRLMPRWFLTRTVRAKIEAEVKDFASFVGTSPLLIEKLRNSPRSEFYGELRRTLEA